VWAWYNALVLASSLQSPCTEGCEDCEAAGDKF